MAVSFLQIYYFSLPASLQRFLFHLKKSLGIVILKYINGCNHCPVMGYWQNLREGLFWSLVHIHCWTHPILTIAWNVLAQGKPGLNSVCHETKQRGMKRRDRDLCTGASMKVEGRWNKVAIINFLLKNFVQNLRFKWIQKEDYPQYKVKIICGTKMI